MFLNDRIPKDETNQGSRFSVELVAAGEGRAHNGTLEMPTLNLMNEGVVTAQLPTIWL